MKKTVLTLFLTLATTLVFAQDKGSWWVSGRLSYSQDKSELSTGSELKTTNLDALPYIEYFFAETWSLNVGVNATYEREKGLGNLRGYELGPYVSVIKYLPVTDKFSFYAEVYGVGRWGTTKINGASYKNNYYGFGVSPGLAYRISPKISFYTELGGLGYYTETLEHKDSGEKATDKGFGANWLGDSFSIGVQFKLK